jgi:hypothetical protein
MGFFTVTEDTTPEELRRRYRQLSREHHPDKGGNNETQAQINTEYEKALAELSTIAARNGDSKSSDRLLQLMQQHLRKMYSEMKTPLIRRYVPEKYQGLAMEVAKLIEGSL